MRCRAIKDFSLGSFLDQGLNMCNNYYPVGYLWNYVPRGEMYGLVDGEWQLAIFLVVASVALLVIAHLIPGKSTKSAQQGEILQKERSANKPE